MNPKIDHLRQIFDGLRGAAREAASAVQAVSQQIRDTRAAAETARHDARGYDSPEAVRIEARLPALLAERDRLQAARDAASARADAAGRLVERCVEYVRQHPEARQ